MLEHSTPSSPRALRNLAMLAMLIGCGLRRAELLALTLRSHLATYEDLWRPTGGHRSGTSLLQDHALTAPVSWIAVGECLGEGPPVAADVPDDVLPLAVDMIDRRLQNLRAAGSDVLEVGGHVRNPDHDLVADVVRADLRATLTIDVLRDDHGAVSDDQLGAMVRDLKPFPEPEDVLEPFDRLSHVRIRQDRNHGR